MSACTSLGHPLHDQAALGRTIDEFLAARPGPLDILALGEPTHGIAAFPLLRNELLAHLVARGFRSIVLETDYFTASVVDDYVNGGAADLDTVLATGFSHRFGAVPGNRELVTWLRTHNAERAPRDRVRFHGFDAPLEQTDVPSPRHSLTSAVNLLPVALRPASAQDLDTLLGEDADWTNPAGIYDPSASIGDSDRVPALRLVADDVASALRRAAPLLDPADHASAVAHARTAQGLLRFHTAMADLGPDRFATLLSLRTEMMADNLLAVRAAEQERGPSLVFAHNVHLQRAVSTMAMGDTAVRWCSAGALVAGVLGDRYAFLASDAKPQSTPDTLQGLLAAATTGRTLFPAPALRAALPASTTADAPILPGHIPLEPADLAGADAVVFVADTDGRRHDYW
ncbi:erythromycin esterase [Nocardia neocaledoniensis NBRC 108232]|uniref:Erythromycin esterase-like protein n=1 Tax=Nocardia neocaledoniensis TaxID=236511 RepID=A0A317P0C8_9NOCA|nr:erythromycin esterase family protein [Nocardia neocaledoniensis]PWV80950.1 erythromycin esterase-like protein [Nocardia neocaledoniensis]GEM34444.1 erythromycin esterase [Nocardia neocaledoniensis NBRC 108232]